jgi:ribosome-binding ATPase YchF (GTP1/OBG family)
MAQKKKAEPNAFVEAAKALEDVRILADKGKGIIDKVTAQAERMDEAKKSLITAKNTLIKKQDLQTTELTNLRSEVLSTMKEMVAAEKKAEKTFQKFDKRLEEQAETNKKNQTVLVLLLLAIVGLTGFALYWLYELKSVG